MIAQRASSLFEDHARLIRHERRQRIFAAARRFEHVAAFDLASLKVSSFAGHAKLVFGTIVEGFQIGVSQGPVGERGILGDRRHSVTFNRVRPHAEVVFVKPPRHGAVMHRAAPCLVAVIQNRQRFRGHIRVRPPGHWLTFRVWTQILPLEVSQFVLSTEIGGSQAWASLEANDFHACFPELGSKYSAYGAHTDNNHISFFDRHSSSLRLYRPVIGARLNACLLSMSVLVKIGCAPGKPTSRHPAKSLLPP